jgi:phospholipid/cholesterol/gamma-HCH transport system substrate-binding protein
MDKTKALTWSELRVGLVMLASLTLLAVTILYVGGGGARPFATKYEVKALMSDVNGLKPSSPVRVGGVEVGIVTRVEFASDAPGLVEVAMRLDRRVQGRVTTGSRASLGSLGLLGEKAVDISTSTQGPPVESGGYLAAEGEDPVKGLLTDASASTGHLRKILSRMDAGEGLIGKALRDEELYMRMVDVSVRLQGVLGKLENVGSPLGRLVNDKEMSERLSASARALEGVATRIDNGEGALGSLTRDEELARDLKNLTARLHELADGLSKGRGTAGKLLQDDAFFRRLDSTFDRLDKVLGRLESGEGTAGRMLRDEELYTNLNGALKDLRDLVATVRGDPGKYLRVKLSLF